MQKRNVRIVGFCILPEDLEIIDNYRIKRNKHQSRSNFIKEAVDWYVKQEKNEN